MTIPSRSTDDIQDELDVLSAQCGDREAVRGLAARWQARLVAYALRLTGDREGAKDVVQETWVSVVRGIGMLRDPSGFRPWIYRIASRRAADWVRGRQRVRKVEEAVGELIPETVGKDPAVERLREAISQLPPGQRDLLQLHYTEGLRIREIAAVLSVPEGTVKSRLAHARDELRKQIKDLET